MHALADKARRHHQSDDSLRRTAELGELSGVGPVGPDWADEPDGFRGVVTPWFAITCYEFSLLEYELSVSREASKV